ncbi:MULTISPECIES: hypothetical protein [unclassified Moorena]|uniref:hypothetical protein n=1 Tax=unclassified Moorena TaxID=2683338 RepID=UPI0013B96372|nr:MULTISPECIES: hypothetical protein [unclassified Moorena]NEP32157.1 hypothetical protein [Moorena sp. SIO3B2]NER86554.1 hypothetical protein [Moorena sp. SIO3A2]
MIRSGIIRKWIVSPDGKVVVQAESRAFASGDQVNTSQEVTVTRESGRSYSRSSSSSFASSTGKNKGAKSGKK